jgi:hypothetical protein
VSSQSFGSSRRSGHSSRSRRLRVVSRPAVCARCWGEREGGGGRVRVLLMAVLHPSRPDVYKVRAGWCRSAAIAVSGAWLRCAGGPTRGHPRVGGRLGVHCCGSGRAPADRYGGSGREPRGLSGEVESQPGLSRDGRRLPRRRHRQGVIRCCALEVVSAAAQAQRWVRRFAQIEQSPKASESVLSFSAETPAYRCIGSVPACSGSNS